MNPQLAVANARKPWHILIVIVLVTLAGVHCTLSIFYNNDSWLDLSKYIAGQERSPYQQRIGVIPALRVLRNSGISRRFAAKLGPRERRHGHDEYISPETSASMLIGLASVLASLGLCLWYGLRALPRFWWLPAVIVLGILYTSYATRYEHALWFPYDLPHMFLFGAACLFLLTDKPWLFLLFFLVDLPVRETSVFLVLLSLAYTTRRFSRPGALGITAALFACWLAVHLVIAHHVHGVGSETGKRLSRNLHYLLAPGDLPTVFSGGGFLLLPVWLGRKRLAAIPRGFVWLTLPCLVVTFVYGFLIESRIFVEWTIPLAVLATQEISSLVREAGTDPLQTVARA